MAGDTEIEGPGYQERPALRHRGADGADGKDGAYVAVRVIDRVAEEAPVALVFNGISHAVMMATPCELEAFALGFALTEGLVAARAEVFDIEVRQLARGFEVELTIAQQNFMQLKQQRRSMAGRSGCGVCGIESIELLDLAPAPVDRLAEVDVAPEAVARAWRELAGRQALMRDTGGVHAAAWCSVDGAIVRACEDVGRHNALDKLIGHLALDGVDMRRGFVFMSSRGSYELVRKAARMRIPVLATISAPSTLAIDIAAQAGMRLLGFCREHGCVEYV